MNELGFVSRGRCNCAGRPLKWVHANGMYAKKWDAGHWKLFDKHGRLIRYGYAGSDMEGEISEHMKTL